MYTFANIVLEVNDLRNEDRLKSKIINTIGNDKQVGRFNIYKLSK